VKQLYDQDENRIPLIGDQIRGFSDEDLEFRGSGVGIEPRKLQYGIAALVWSLIIGI
jgi:hypothetical protein